MNNLPILAIISYTKAGQRYKVLGSGYHAVYTKKPYKVIIK